MRHIYSGAKVQDSLGRVGTVTDQISPTRVVVDFAHGQYVMYTRSLRPVR